MGPLLKGDVRFLRLRLGKEDDDDEDDDEDPCDEEEAACKGDEGPKEEEVVNTSEPKCHEKHKFCQRVRQRLGMKRRAMGETVVTVVSMACHAQQDVLCLYVACASMTRLSLYFLV